MPFLPCIPAKFAVVFPPNVKSVYWASEEQQVPWKKKWVIIRSFDLLSLLAHLLLFSSSKDYILLRFCQLVTPHGFYIKFDIKQKNFSSIQTKNKLIFTQIV